MLFNWTKRAYFLRQSLFQAMHNNKTEKQSMHLAYVSLMLGDWWKEKLGELIVCFSVSMLFLEKR